MSRRGSRSIPTTGSWTSERADAPRKTPTASSPDVRLRMQAVRQRDTRPELALRAELHRLGLRYRVGIPPLPNLRRRADVVFPRARVAVFVDGCFWHGCPIHGTTPKRNSQWWTSKIETNKARDADTDKRLHEEGWTVLRFWEHDDPIEAAQIIAHHVRASLQQRHRGLGTSPTAVHLSMRNPLDEIDN